MPNNAKPQLRQGRGLPGEQNPSYRHGYKARGTRNRTYDIWQAMKQRCSNPKHPHYDVYGARGIRVCERWSSDFAAFVADMGEAPPKHSIDRLDVDGDYTPANCKWSTQHEQLRNMRTNVWVVVNGQRMIVADAARLTGVPVRLVRYRMKQYGWPIEEAIGLVPHVYGRPGARPRAA